MMFKRKPKTDTERLNLAIDLMNELRYKMSRNDPWGFVGAVIITYHALREGHGRAGNLDVFEKYERDILNAAQIEFKESRTSADAPYK